MTEYLTGSVYQRWFRQYHANLAAYVRSLDALRIRVGTLPLGERETIEEEIYNIDEHVEEAVARDFSADGEPLETGELFLENCKVIANSFLKLLGKPPRFEGIYKAEKERVRKVHQSFKFKEKLEEVRNKILAFEFFEEKQRTELSNVG